MHCSLSRPLNLGLVLVDQQHRESLGRAGWSGAVEEVVLVAAVVERWQAKAVFDGLGTRPVIMPAPTYHC